MFVHFFRTDFQLGLKKNSFEMFELKVILLLRERKKEGDRLMERREKERDRLRERREKERERERERESGVFV